MSLRIFFNGEDGDPCEYGRGIPSTPEEGAHHSGDLHEPAIYNVEDENRQQWPICARHKDIMKADGLAL